MNGPYHPHTAHRRRHRRGRLRLGDATALAVGGMIGGGIFGVLGVVVELSGHLAFASFVIGGVLAALTARAYAALTLRSGRSGGPFEYLRDAGHPEMAAVTAWLLIVGYIFALAVYAFTFGHYGAAVVGAPLIVARLLSALVMAVLLVVNLRGVLTSSVVEDVIVAVKVLVLAGIAAVGLAHLDAGRLSPLTDAGGSGVFVGAALIFVAYEGFELLVYDYDEIDDPRRTLPRALFLSVGLVSTIYVAVTIGSQMLVSDRLLIGQRETAFAEVGQAALGTFGRWIATLAAVLATASAINATLFSTARLMRDVSARGELPRSMGAVRDGVPRRSLLVLCAGGIAFAMLPGLQQLVSFGSLTFLAVFALIGYLDARTEARRSRQLLSVLGLVGCSAALAVLVVELARHDTGSLVLVAVCFAGVAIGRVVFRRRRPPVSPSRTSTSR